MTSSGTKFLLVRVAKLNFCFFGWVSSGEDTEGFENNLTSSQEPTPDDRLHNVFCKRDAEPITGAGRSPRKVLNTCFYLELREQKIFLTASYIYF